jgi:mannosylglycerate hydrolase
MEECGELSATMASEIVMKLPIRLEKETNLGKLYGKRATEEREVTIRTSITLHRGERGIKLRTLIDNTVEDHILKVVFPTGIQAEHSAAAGHFYVDRRPIRPVHEHQGGYYPDMQTLPLQTFVDVSDGTIGLAVISKDLAEYEVKNNADRTIAMTLLKSTRTVVCTEFRTAAKYPSDNGCQMLGKTQLEYGLTIHDGDYLEGKIHDVAQRFNTPLRLVQTGYHTGQLPSQTSLFSLEGELVLSAMKQSEDGNSVVMRVFNPTGKPIQGKVKSFVPISKAEKVTMEEVIIAELAKDEAGAIRISLNPWEIGTLKITCQR